MTTLDPRYDAPGHATRDRILHAARQLFAERGYAATSLADIASAVGVTKTAVAYHFHPKDRLAAELIAPAANDIIALIETEFGDERAFLEALVTFVIRHRAIIRLIMEEIGGADDAPPGSPARPSAPSATASTSGSPARTPIRPAGCAPGRWWARSSTPRSRRSTCPRRSSGRPC
nr:hypothetical protein GCM10020093_101480 [Planobispora longispora]